MTQLNFDARTVKPDEGRGDPLPAGWYNVAADSSEMKATAKGDGAFLSMVFKVLDGQYQGRQIYFNFNLRNPNPQTQEIAYKQLSAVCHATGRLTVGDSSELHGIPLKIKIKIRPASGDYDAANDITSFKNINEPVQTGNGVQAPAGFAPPSGAPQAPQQFAPPAQAPQQFAPPAGAPQQQQQFAPQQQQGAPGQAVPWGAPQ